MIRSFSDEFLDGCEDIARELLTCRERSVSVVTGVAAYPTLCNMASKLERLSANLKISVYEIKNRFFGESITVSGLLTGVDIEEQLRGKFLGEELLVPANCLRHGEEVFLCGMTLGELSERLGVKIRVTENDGFDFIDAVFGK